MLSFTGITSIQPIEHFRTRTCVCGGRATTFITHDHGSSTLCATCYTQAHKVLAATTERQRELAAALDVLISMDNSEIKELRAHAIEESNFFGTRRPTMQRGMFNLYLLLRQIDNLQTETP